MKQAEKHIQKTLKNRSDIRKTQSGHLSILGYMNLCFGDDMLRKNCNFIINSGRNCGKTTQTWDEIIIPIMWEILGWKGVYVRTNQKKLEAARIEFNNTYKGRYYMNNTHIYRITLDENGHRIYDLDEEIGMIVGVCNEENFKSLKYKGYHWIFYEEYNEINNHIGLWRKWIALMTSVKRNNFPFWVILAGNRNSGNSDIMNKLGIIPSDIVSQSEGGTKDVIMELKKDFYFVDVATETFRDLLSNLGNALDWASFDEETQNYLTGDGYLSNYSDNVVVYKKQVQPTATPIMNLTFDNYKMVFGKYDNTKFYIHITSKIDNNKKTLALNLMGYMTNKTSDRFAMKDEYIDFANTLMEQYKRNNLYFTSFDAKNIIEKYVITILDLNIDI